MESYKYPKKMYNKWSLYQDSDLWEYRFPVIELKERNLNYRNLLEAFITACHTSEVSRLHSGTRENFSEKLDEMLDLIEHIKSQDESGSYPFISTLKMNSSISGRNEDYLFDNGLYVYDKEGVVVQKRFTLLEMKSVLTEIDHGQADYTGLSLPFEFSTHNEVEFENVKSYNFYMTFYSDIWLDEVPCIHCEEEESVKNDNSELAALNRKNMNNFLDQMKQVCTDFGGEMIVEQENLRWLYQGKFSAEGFVL